MKKILLTMSYRVRSIKYKDKGRVLLFLILNTLYSALSFSQTPGQWTWMRGDSTTGSAGSFGTLGIPSATNEPPAVYEASEWTDQNCNLWHYGGQDGNFNFYADLWKYDVGLNEYTWIKGPGTYNAAGVY